jgi:hypothetical protein
VLYSNNSTITNITASNNNLGIGIHSSDNTIKDGVLVNNGIIVSKAKNSVENTTVNGRPLIYLEGVENYELNETSNAGQVILVGCRNFDR